MVTLKIDETRLLSTIALIENHLDGAVADYESGDMDNVAFIEDLAYVHKMLELASTGGWSALRPDEYVERIGKRREQLAKERKDED